MGSIGAMIEDKNSGTILLQQALRRGMQATAIDSKLTAMGKDERALSVSGYVYCGKVKYTDYAFNKVVTYKRRTKNHLVDQIEGFRMRDKDAKRDDDLLDTFCYGISISLGNNEGVLMSAIRNPGGPTLVACWSEPRSACSSRRPTA
jgi:hypothetical protein